MDQACPNPALALAVAPQVKRVTAQPCVRPRQVSVQGRVELPGICSFIHWQAQGWPQGDQPRQSSPAYTEFPSLVGQMVPFLDGDSPEGDTQGQWLRLGRGGGWGESPLPSLWEPSIEVSGGFLEEETWWN